MCNRSGGVLHTGRYLIFLCQCVSTVPRINCVLPLEMGMSHWCVFSSLHHYVQLEERETETVVFFSLCNCAVPGTLAHIFQLFVILVWVLVKKCLYTCTPCYDAKGHIQIYHRLKSLKPCQQACKPTHYMYENSICIWMQTTHERGHTLL